MTTENTPIPGALNNVIRISEASSICRRRFSRLRCVVSVVPCCDARQDFSTHVAKQNDKAVLALWGRGNRHGPGSRRELMISGRRQIRGVPAESNFLHCE